MGDAGSRRDNKNKSTLDNYDSVVNGILPRHWLKIMGALARVHLKATDGWRDHSLQGTRLQQRQLFDINTRLDWRVFMEKFHNRAEYKRHIRMLAVSFIKQVDKSNPTCTRG